MKIEAKTVVKMHYTGTLEDGSKFDSSEGREPLEFIYGNGMIIPGLEEGLAGLEVGAKKVIGQIAPEKAYGPRMDEAMQEMPKEQLPEEIRSQVAVGMQLMAQGPQGPIPVTVADVKEETVVMDFNHPLAGKSLTFDVEIVEVREATKEELEHGHVHGADGHHHHEEHEKDLAPEEASLEDSLDESKK
jgi:FKBP-type peptidyl-prolyl cis-trans isomerase SlyD